jgi:hypothetical protein
MQAVAGFFVIVVGKTFNSGDRIEMGGVRGDVLDIGLLKTTVMEMGVPARPFGVRELKDRARGDAVGPRSASAGHCDRAVAAARAREHASPQNDASPSLAWAMLPRRS